MHPEVRAALIKFTLSMATLLAFSTMGSELIGDLTNPEERDGITTSRLTELLREYPGRRVDVHALSSHQRTVLSEVRSPSGDGFSSVGGVDLIKKELTLHFIVPLRHHDTFYASPSLRPPAGILLHGPPGSGKTLLAHALAVEAAVPLVSVTASSVESKWFGESEKLLRAVFSVARLLQPCIVFFDEIDGLMRDRSDGEHSATYSVKTQLLIELDALDKDGSSVVVVAATNKRTALDAALHRRLPRTYYLGKPADAKARREVLSRVVASDRVSESDLDMVAERTAGLSGSDLRDTYRLATAFRNEAFSAALLQHGAGGVRCSPVPISTHHWTAAVQRMMSR